MNSHFPNKIMYVTNINKLKLKKLKLIPGVLNVHVSPQLNVQMSQLLAHLYSTDLTIIVDNGLFV